MSESTIAQTIQDEAVSSRLDALAYAAENGYAGPTQELLDRIHAACTATARLTYHTVTGTDLLMTTKGAADVLGYNRCTTCKKRFHPDQMHDGKCLSDWANENERR